MEVAKKVEDRLEEQFGESTDNRGKANSEIIKKAQAKAAKEQEDRAVEEAQRNLAKTDFIKQRTLLENRRDKAKANNKNKYTIAICDAADKYTAGEIDTDEQKKLIREADKELVKANDEADNKYSTEYIKLRNDNPLGYRAAEW